jgi:ribA/ribD-fused uncharacterized protein
MPSASTLLRWLVLVLGAVVFATAAPVASLRLIGVQSLPRTTTADQAPVGGLSGIDYDAANDRWLAVSDDRSEHGPTRAYVLRLDYDAQAFRSAAAESVVVLRQPDGSAYPDRATQTARGGEIADCESLRLDPAGNSFWYSSEGDSSLGMQPFVRQATRDGKFLQELPLPAMLRFSPTGTTGPRSNLVFEGISFAADGQSLWVALEGPLLEDGPVPTVGQGAPVRLTQFSLDGRVLAQRAYPLDPIPMIAGARTADNGLSELLVNGNELLVLERAGVRQDEGSYRFHPRLYAASVEAASDIREVARLSDATFTPMRKRLLVNFDEVRPGGADNLEGIAWGRRLPNGHDTLVLVADDNFNAAQTSELWVFEVIPGAATASAKPARQWDDLFEGVVHDDRRVVGFVGDYRWLSNYFPCPVRYEGRAYGSSEAAYHASKFPENERDEFTKLDPDAAKKLSRRKQVDQAWWDARKERVMREINFAKFTQNPELAARLLATGDRHLEEANWWGDQFWGTVQGKGQNVLGRVLMDLRAQLRSQAAK